MNNTTQIWNNALELIEEEIPAVGFNTWIKTIIPESIEGNVINLSVTSIVNKNMVDKRYSDLIRNALYEVTGVYFDINVTFSDNPVVKQAEPTTQRSRDLGFPLIPKYTFDTFVVGNSNRFAHAAALAVAEAPAMTYNPLFLYGGVGLGKTHLLHAIGNYIIQNNPSARVMYTSSETFTNELINSIKDFKNEEFRNKYRSMDVLMVDDIQFIAGKEKTEEEFFHTFNELHQDNKHIIITSDRPPKEIKSLEERLRSRFEWGLIGDINTPDFETRAAILKKKAQSENIQVSDEILMFIADKINSNIRELEGVFNRVIAYRGLVNREITMEVVMEALKDYDLPNKKLIITPEIIISSCSKYFGLREDELLGNRRTKEIARARQVAMYLLREITNMSHLKIGKFFDKDHTTIMHGIKQVEKAIVTEDEMKITIESLTKDIKG